MYKGRRCLCLLYVFSTRDVLGNIGVSAHINYSHLEPILPQDTVDRLEQNCLNIVKVKTTAF